MPRRMRFRTWCKKDLEDTTPIHYTFRSAEWTVGGKKEHNTLYFTSDDIVPFSMLDRIAQAWVEKIELIDNGSQKTWNVVIYED